VRLATGCRLRTGQQFGRHGFDAHNRPLSARARQGNCTAPGVPPEWNAECGAAWRGDCIVSWQHVRAIAGGHAGISVTRVPMTLIPTQVTFRGLRTRTTSSPTFVSVDVAGTVLRRHRALSRGHRGPHRHRHDGRHVHVRIELTVPGGPPIVASHEPSLHGRLKDVEEEEHHKETEIESVHCTRPSPPRGVRCGPPPTRRLCPRAAWGRQDT
jgi:hypothetical protein